MNIYHQPIWRTCTRYNDYEVSNNARVRNIKLNKLIGISNTRFVSRLINLELDPQTRRELSRVCLKQDGKVIREYIRDLMEEEFTDEEIRNKA